MPKQASKELIKVIVEPILTSEEEIAIREALGTSFELECKCLSEKWRGVPDFSLIITIIAEAIVPLIAEDAWKAFKGAIKKISESRSRRKPDEKSRLEFHWRNRGISITFDIDINDKKGEQLFAAVPEIIRAIANSVEAT